MYENSLQLLTVNYFFKKLHLKCFTRFWIRVWNSFEKCYSIKKGLRQNFLLINLKIFLNSYYQEHLYPVDLEFFFLSLYNSGWPLLNFLIKPNLTNHNKVTWKTRKEELYQIKSDPTELPQMVILIFAIIRQGKTDL